MAIKQQKDMERTLNTITKEKEASLKVRIHHLTPTGDILEKQDMSWDRVIAKRFTGGRRSNKWSEARDFFRLAKMILYDTVMVCTWYYARVKTHRTIRHEH